MKQVLTLNFCLYLKYEEREDNYIGMGFYKRLFEKQESNFLTYNYL